MNDLISRSALLAAYDKAHKGPPGGARKLIEEAPSVDAVLVVDGKRMRYKDFEIRPASSLAKHTNPDKWEVVKWYKRKEPARVYDLELGAFKMSDTYCFTIAFIEWNDKEPCWEFRSVGTRFLEYYEDGLCEFICKWLELADLTRGIDDE